MTGTKIDEFTRAYIECALWSSTDDDGNPLDEGRSAEDIAPECFEEMLADCADFQTGFADLLAQTGADADQNGHDFWLTRNRHGAGFWGRGYGDVGKQLTDMSHPYGEFNLYVGDDGKIYGA